MTPLGILSALSQEAKVFTRAKKIGEPIQLTKDLIFIRSGIGHDNATHCAALLRDAGAGALMSFGVCGAINPERKTGDLLLPVSISDGLEVIDVSATWRAALQENLGMWSPNNVTQLHSDKPVGSVENKKLLFESSNADAVDMESFAVAQVASTAGLPFIILRVVLDDAATALPNLALSTTNEQGEVQYGRLLAGLLKRPQEISGLIRLGSQLRRAIGVLRWAKQQAGPCFLCDHV